jgi:hypothetical protein
MQRVTPVPWQLKADASKSIHIDARRIYDAGSDPLRQYQANAGRQSDIAEAALHCPACQQFLRVNNSTINRGGKLQSRLAQVHACARSSQAS